eukprot:1152785_1
MSPLLLLVSISSLATATRTTTTTTTSPPVSTSSNEDYIFITWPQRTMNWISAQSYCHATYNSDLATILTDTQFDLIINYSTSIAMIGLQKDHSDDVWSWINGPSSHIHVTIDPVTQAYCSQLVITSASHYFIQSIDCNTPYTQFYCNKARGYIYIHSAKTFTDAEEHCKNRYGTHLATITRSRDLQNALQLAENNNIWIGLYRTDEYDLWLDGTAYVEQDINPLASHNIYSNCATLNVDHAYITSDIPCHIMLPFLCNKRRKTREYILHKLRKTYIEAQQVCVETHGTDLATVITEEEFSDVMRFIPQSQGAWIGLKKLYRNHVYNWGWIDGTLCTESQVCVPYWQRDGVVDEPVYECGWLWQHGRARTAKCTHQMDYFLCNKPRIYYEIEKEGNVITTDKEIVMIPNVVNINANENAKSRELWHGKTLYYLHPEQPYDSMYRMPANWVVIAGYIGIGVLVFTVILYCVMYCVLLTQPLPIKTLERRQYSV